MPEPQAGDQPEYRPAGAVFANPCSVYSLRLITPSSSLLIGGGPAISSGARAAALRRSGRRSIAARFAFQLDCRGEPGSRCGSGTWFAAAVSPTDYCRATVGEVAAVSMNWRERPNRSGTAGNCARRRRRVGSQFHGGTGRAAATQKRISWWRKEHGRSLLHRIIRLHRNFELRSPSKCRAAAWHFVFLWMPTTAPFAAAPRGYPAGLGKSGRLLFSARAARSRRRRLGAARCISKCRR